MSSLLLQKQDVLQSQSSTELGLLQLRLSFTAKQDRFGMLTSQHSRLELLPEHLNCCGCF